MFIESSLWEEILMKVHYFVHLRELQGEGEFLIVFFCNINPNYFFRARTRELESKMGQTAKMTDCRVYRAYAGRK